MANSKDTNRLFVFEPNPDENRLIPNEDYSILVELKTTKKGRSFITSGGVENTGGESGEVNFIAGTKVGYYPDGKPRNSLTTNYTEASTDFSVDGNTDLETFGIESIQIDFDTAYVPNIKIKFIDIRGQSIFQRGNSSKYSIFFELPYPLFELTIKGFYGKPVTYCLHLFKWNSSFNSSTGNFEVNAEFLGYTYAMLTDMLLGLLRAVITTEEGIPFWAKAKAEYAAAGITLKSIDEFLEDINKLGDEFKKLQNEDSTVQQLDVNVEIQQIISKIKLKIAQLANDITTKNNIFNNRNGVLGTSKENAISTKVQTIIKKFKEDVKKALDGDSNDDEVNGLNDKIENDALKIKTNDIIDIIQFKPIKYKDIKGEIASEDSELVKKIKNNGSYTDEKAILLANIIKGNKPKPSPADDAEIVIFDITKAFDEIKRVEVRLEDNNSKIREELGAELAKIAEEKLEFKPTIRNIFRILTTHCEVFMDTLKSVSAKYTNKERVKTLQKVVKGDGDFADNTKTDVNNKVIYPWPEYREKITKNDQTYFEEAWLGKPILDFSNGVTEFNNVPELVFVEHLLEELIKLKQKDDALRTTTELKRIQYYPVSALDSPISSNLITSTPYNAALFGPNASSKPNEAIRCLLLRGFLAFGVANKNLPNNIIETMGKLEAENLFNTVNEDFDSILGRDFLQELTTLGGGDAKQAAKEVIATAKVGYTNIVNPTGVGKPLLSEVGSNYNYTYISNNGIYYIPISGGYDGKNFYSGNNFKDDSELLSVSDDILFTSNVTKRKDYTPLGNINPNFKGKKDDGSVYFKIILRSEYEQSLILPEYGSEVLDDYNKKLTGKLIKQSTLKPLNIPISDIDPYSTTQKALEISDIIYDGTGETIHFNKTDTTVSNQSSVLSAYWFSITPTTFNQESGFYGTYLCNGVTSNDKIPASVEIPLNETEKIKNYTWVNNPSIGDRSSTKSYSNVKLKPITDFGDQRRLLGTILGETSETIKPYTPFIEFLISNGQTTNFEIRSAKYFSLFGSKFYYTQTKLGRAFLFLHSFSWQGLIGKNVKGEDRETFSNLFSDAGNYTIKELFQNNSSFIKAPKLWCAFIGGLLHRHEEGETNGSDIINFDGLTLFGKNHISSQLGRPNDPPLPEDKWSKTPQTNQYLYVNDSINPDCGIHFFFDGFRSTNRGDTTNNYKDIDNNLIRLPEQIKKEFKRIFFNFVDEEFKQIQENFEIVDNYTENAWKINYDALIQSSGSTSSNIVDSFNRNILYGDIEKLKKINFKANILDTYSNISPITTPGFKLNRFSRTTDTNKAAKKRIQPYQQINLIIRKDSNASNFLNTLIGDYVYILNGSPESMCVPKLVGDARISSTKEDMDLYLENFFTRLSKLFETLAEKQKEESDTIKKDIFNSTDDDFIKLNLYRTLASINNKWLGELTTNTFQQCGCSKYDLDVAKSENLKINRLIHSFRFLDVGYADIGDDFYLNPFAIQKLIVGNYNKSFFDVANDILSDNNFNFIPLPNFINFNELSEVVDVFDVKPYDEAIKAGNQSGPAFVCIYVGQTSTSLDLGEEANYQDDGVIVTLDSSGNILKVPPIFTGQKQNNGDLNIPLFLVSYGLQNQSFFKDIKLDQTEFTETAESLEIIEDISLSGDKRKPSFNGQNLWNVYQKRSYSAEVEMMGCAMIQPFMYFQLDDVPLFRGAYNIYKTSHSITPHNMVTKFKGNRVKRTKTPLMSKETLFMNLLGSLNNAGTGSDINENSGTGTSNTSINLDNIEKSGDFFIEEKGAIYIVNKSNGLAGKTLRDFMKDLSDYLGGELGGRPNLKSNGITRDLKQTLAGGPSRDPKSKHGAGLAIDVLFLGDYQDTKNNNVVTNFQSPYPLPVNKETDYYYPNGNLVVANDYGVMTKIKQFLTTSQKWKGWFKWGGDFKNRGGRKGKEWDRKTIESTESSISDFVIRVDEIHHFELLPSKWPPFFKPYENDLKNLGVGIPKNKEELGALYKLAFNFDGSNPTKTAQKYKENKQQGDAVDPNSAIS